MRSYLQRINQKISAVRMRWDVKRGLPVRFTTRGKNYWVNADGSAMYHIVNSTGKIAKMADLIPRSTQTIFDVGANCGLFSAFASLASPGASIYCFEPSSELLPIIDRNVSRDRVSVHGVAVGDSDGQVELFVNTKSQQTNSLNKSAVELFAQPGNVQSRMVDCIRLDTFAEGKGIQKIDVLKVDVQGYEGAVFRGCGDLVSTVEMLFVESTWMDIESIVETIPFALEHGFTHVSVLNPVHMGADIILSRRKINSPYIKIDFPISKELLVRRWT